MGAGASVVRVDGPPRWRGGPSWWTAGPPLSIILARMDVSLEQMLERVPSGLPVAVGCWVVARAADALASAPRAVTPREVRVAGDGAVEIAPPRPGAAPFAYLAPEVVRGQDPDGRSAIFGLGALLVEAVTGRCPFARASDMETRLAVAEDSVPPLVGQVAEASPELDAIVQRALAKDPAERFASMSELAARIDAFLADELHDVGPERLAAVAQATLAGSSASEALFARGFAPPPPGAPLGEPKVRIPHDAPVTAPSSRPAPAPARGPIRAPSTLEPALSRGPTPSPGALEPTLPAPPPKGAAARFEDAELDLSPEGDRASSPTKPKLDTGVDRAGDPLRLDEAEPSSPRADPPSRRPPGRARISLDEVALREHRNRPGTLAPEPQADAPPNWLARLVVLAAIVVAVALAYQFVLRPLLK